MKGKKGRESCSTKQPSRLYASIAHGEPTHSGELCEITLCRIIVFVFSVVISFKVHERIMIIIISHDENRKKAAEKNKNTKSVMLTESSVCFSLSFVFVFLPALCIHFSFEFFDKCEY